MRTETLGTERRELSAGRTPIAATTVGKVEAKVEANASPPPLSADFSAERRRGDLERTKEAEGRGSVLQGAGQSLAAGTMGLQWGHVWGQGGALPKLHGGGEEGKKGGGPMSKQECEQTAELGAAESRGRWAAVDLLL